MKRIILALLIAATINVSAQDSKPKPKPIRYSAVVNFGVPYTMFSLKSDIAGFYEIGLRYSLNKNFSVEASYNIGGFAHSTGGKRTDTISLLAHRPPQLPGASDIYYYNNKVSILNLRANYNLYSLLGFDKRQSKFAPYLTAGLGLSFWKINAIMQNGTPIINDRMQFRPMYMWQLGAGTRYYLNPNIDVNANVLFNYVESYWMDAAPQDKSLDHFLMMQLGVAYKINAIPSNNLIDWSNKNVDNAPTSNLDYGRWSADVTAGLPYLFNEVGGGMGYGLGLSGRYSYSRVVSFQAAYNFIHFGGTQNVSGPVAAPENVAPTEVKEYSSGVNQLALRGRFNLTQMMLGEAESIRKWNLYALAGMSANYFSSDVTLSDNTTKSFFYKNAIQNIHLGAEARFYYNKYFDFVAAAEFHNNQTRWYDGAPSKNSLNNHIYLNVGVSYKFDGKRGCELIDWSYSKYDKIKMPKERKLIDVPVIMPPPAAVEAVTVPVDSAKKEEIAPIEVKKEEPTPPVEVKKEVPAAPVEVIKTPEFKEEPKKAVVPVATSDEITPPPFKYNVVVACYALGHKTLALKFRDRLRNKGFENTQVYRSIGSKWLRVTTISTDDKPESTSVLRKSRNSIDPQSWIHLYNKQ